MNPVTDTRTTFPIADHEEIGLAINGVPFVSLPLVKSFDSCMGHVEKDTHRYHYHVPPICLLVALNIPVPNSTSIKYMLSTNPLIYWPSSSSNLDPIVGWALDGHPIKGPYDSTGQLVLRSSLDSCGGGIDSTTGEYTYRMTAESPYLPSCFVSKPGTLSVLPFLSDDGVLSCPKGGYNLTVNPSSTTPLPELTPPVCDEPYDGPYFLFKLGIDVWIPSGRRAHKFSVPFSGYFSSLSFSL